MTINVGDKVEDIFNGHKGIVVKIEIGYDIQNHGAIYVWQMNRYEYGADNCEHYAHLNWEKHLKIIDKACKHD
jgi:hypothetical protein